jgi:DNA-binding transcriptional ArsR family regulator
MKKNAALDAVFAALSDETRRGILTRLKRGEATVMELAAGCAMSQPAVTKHLQVLERAGLITRRREAQRRPCQLAPAAMERAARWLDGYREMWEARFEKLDGVLAAMEEDGKKGKGK